MTSLRLVISRADLERMVEHARREYPYEACGMVGGREGRGEMVVPLPNASLTPRVHFEIERQAMVDTVMRFHRNGGEVVAIYHSHPDGPAAPSEQDIAQAAWPDAAYIIVGLQETGEPELRAWKLQNGMAEPVELDIVLWVDE